MHNTKLIEDCIRYTDAKLKYYKFILAYQGGNVDEFFDAALNLAKDDILDILFTYKSETDEKFAEVEQLYKERDRAVDSDDSEDISYELELQDVTKDNV